ncbi:sodium/potassium-transporting ATPase subunit beta-2-like [Hyposmocoma kahamanoa]|uniref:sodium/potassium-transporting ATPase subunit beta-2-like n=1 Tax=Hyposmocoma kahamanoa TaxID=1477025 RepID=UPI000E6D7945|nr:sodium/potassium-transporting ATPase subunit beta-2-like [Hyposmocoma kahamanoa]
MLSKPLRCTTDLEVWPRSDDYYTHWEQPVIQFRLRDPGSWHPWVQKINDFLREYETTVPEDPPRAPCSTKRRDQYTMRSETCELAMRTWSPCTADEFYGYALGTPCVFLRLNHIHYWVPEPYNISVPLPIPMDMPENLRQIMHQRPAHQYGDFIWVSCDGEFPADQENIGPIQYIPANMPPGFPTARLHTADRIPQSARGLPDQIPGPLVGVFFENPRRGVLINVECRVWSRDITQYYDRTSRVGRARFELFVE